MVKKSRSGFTLAEVLTTLMVIGVVAAMTIPTLLNSTNDQQLRVAYKKAMSVLSQGVQLMVAKEEECIVQNNHQLAVCMQKVISGTLMKVADDDKLEVGSLAAAAGDEEHGDQGDGNVIVTNDGMAFAFFYNGAAGEDDDAVIANEAYNRSLDDICGSATKLFAAGANVDANADLWNGTSAKCIVVVDMNGPAKGSHSFTADDDDANVAGSDLGADGAAITLGSDQAPLELTGSGVRPLYKSGNSSFNKPYTWIYGANATPFDDD